MGATATVMNERAPVYEITADGQPMDPSTHLIEVRVEQAMGMADRAILRIADPDMTYVDGTTLSPGKALTVKLGAPHTTDPASQVFTGEVVTLEAEMAQTGIHVLIIAFDKSHRLRRQTKTKAWANVTAGDIARSIAGQSGLSIGTLDLTGPPRTMVLQDGESDWQLLERLFDEEGCEISMAGGKLEARKRSATTGSVELTLGTTLRSFHPRLSGVAQVNTVEVRSWDPSQKQVISETATVTPSVTAQTSQRSTVASALGGGALVVVDHPAPSSGVAKVMAASAASAIGAQVIEATGVALGSPGLTVGGGVTIDGVGSRFGGVHRVVALTHVLRGRSGYETRFTVGAGGGPLLRELQRDRPAARGFASNLAIGLVTQNKDPSSQSRIKVKYPVLDNTSESDWIRVAWPAAGSGRGVVAVPSIGDEVIIGFEHGDINRPFMLGALFNGVDTPGAAVPTTVTPQTVAVTVPGDVITTATGKSTTSADAGLSATSNGPVSISAQGSEGLKLSSNGSMDVTSVGALSVASQSTASMQGEAQVSISSNAAVQIKANAALELSGGTIIVNANGVLILKGSMVMIG